MKKKDKRPYQSVLGQCVDGRPIDWAERAERRRWDEIERRLALGDAHAAGMVDGIRTVDEVLGELQTGSRSVNSRARTQWAMMNLARPEQPDRVDVGRLAFLESAERTQRQHAGGGRDARSARVALWELEQAARR